jgi:endonuclease/exonuclease/phosphatase family metal-dependent hydrolase
MAGRSRCGLKGLVTVGCCLVGVMALMAGASSASDGTHPSSDVTGVSLRVLQMNLCDSGIAGCYTGRSVAEAAAVIRAERPDVVTLNEVCGEDVSVLDRALSDADPGGVVVATAFEAAVNRRTGDAVRCRNGQRYGNGLLVRVRPPYRGYATHGGAYSVQDTADPEERVWLCLHAIAHFYACTTHLASTSPIVALSQCRYLLDTAIPALRTHDGSDPVVLGADLNLTPGRMPDPRSCVPAGYAHTDDGARQHIVASTDFTVTSRRSINMHGTTDHPGLLADLSSITKRLSRAGIGARLP